ncbi:UNKNOWN [Stylonychia lemnae]|uniref:Uncharacterized protein n=1 Tax=Stylonychia lemnae TaxID=5949 RepID=A0A078AEM8_STYLE|nr:UNKNOWN [Stylonychia lemnae]|eukprot:CDW80296.1 UNKNOWN [Stylonychia lemnae]
MMSKTYFPQSHSKPEGVYRVSKNIRIKDDELPFTKININNKPRVPAFDSSLMQNSIEVLQKTYYNIAHPPNKKPLSKLKLQPSLSTTNEMVASMPHTTKYCQYSDEFLRAQAKQNQLESELDGDIQKSIKRTSSVADYYKNYGFFYLTKSSQNYANTINSLANFEKSKVLELDNWFTKKIDFKKNEDPDMMLKNKLIQQSEILEATNFQLKSVLKQKSEMFQPGKSIKLMALDSKLLSKNATELRSSALSPSQPRNLKASESHANILNKKLQPLIQINDQTDTQIQGNDQMLGTQNSKFLNNNDSSLNTTNQQFSPGKFTYMEDEPIIMPLSKKQMWEIKERNTTVEVKLQYTIIKLEEKMNEMKQKLESLRIENCNLSEIIKSKYGQEMQSQYFSDGLTDGSRTSKISPNLMRSKRATGKVEDFMKMKAVRDQLNQKKEKINGKIAKCNERIQNNVNQIHMFEYEVDQIRKDINSTKAEQVEHYQKLLKEGIDSRKDGLIWIIKAIWHLGNDVNLADMPNYLDSESISFLLDYGKLDIKRSELHHMLKDLKLRCRKDRIHQVYRNKSMSMSRGESQERQNQSPPPKSFGFFKKSGESNKQKKAQQRMDLFGKKTKEEILKQAKEKLHEMAQTIEVVNQAVEENEDIDILMQLYEEHKSHEISSQEISEEETVQLQSSQKFVQSPLVVEGVSSYQRRESLIDIDRMQKQFAKIDQKTLEIEIVNLEKRYSGLKTKMRRLKQEALERIGKEFMLNNYQKRFKINQEVVLSAIVGEDKAKETMSKQLKKQDDYRRIVEKNKTFTFSSLRMTTTTVNRQTMNTLHKS